MRKGTGLGRGGAGAGLGMATISLSVTVMSRYKKLLGTTMEFLITRGFL